MRDQRWEMRVLLGTADSWSRVDAIFGGCCAQGILYSVYAVLGVHCARWMLCLVNTGLTVWCAQCMLYSVYAVLCVCCTLCMLYSVYAVYSVCCTPGMQYSVYAVLSVCCGQCMLYSDYALLSVNSWPWRGGIVRDNLISCAQVKVELIMRKREMRGHGGNRHEKLELKRNLCTGKLTIPYMAHMTLDLAC